MASQYRPCIPQSNNFLCDSRGISRMTMTLINWPYLVPENIWGRKVPRLSCIVTAVHGFSATEIIYCYGNFVREENSLNKMMERVRNWHIIYLRIITLVCVSDNIWAAPETSREIMKIGSREGQGDAISGDCTCCCNFPSCHECCDSLSKQPLKEQAEMDRSCSSWSTCKRSTVTSFYKGEFL
jgi:hypothetical protein